MTCLKRFRLLASLLAIGSLLTPRAAADDSESEFLIKVRASVDQPFTVFGRSPAPDHSKLYALAGIKAASTVETDTSSPLVIPVDEDALRAELKSVLSANGFRETAWGKAPDIVITVIYGRSQMRNPYADQSTEIAGNGMGFDSKVMSSTPEEMLRERQSPGYYERLQNADGEKLFMIITAWKYPGFNPTEKPKLEWRTTVFLDDPDRDLNLVAGKMLAAAGKYFDRKIEREEVAIPSTRVETPAPPK